jgi:hypothetical protein
MLSKTGNLFFENPQINTRNICQKKDVLDKVILVYYLVNVDICQLFKEGKKMGVTFCNNFYILGFKVLTMQGVTLSKQSYVLSSTLIRVGFHVLSL